MRRLGDVGDNLLIHKRKQTLLVPNIPRSITEKQLVCVKEAFHWLAAR
jgi:hypothetical protein